MEGGRAGINGDSEGLLLDLIFDLGDRIADLSPFFNFTNGLAGFVLAVALSSCGSREVRVVFVGHDTLVFDEVPSPGHPATLASICLIVLAKSVEVVVVSRQGTVDDLLFRETHWWITSFNGSCAFHGCQGSKGPTGTTVTLVLYGNHVAIGEVVNFGGSVDPEYTTIFPVISECGLFGLCLGLIEAEELLILSGLEIGCPIMSKDEDIRVAAASGLTIMLCN